MAGTTCKCVTGINVRRNIERTDEQTPDRWFTLRLSGRGRAEQRIVLLYVRSQLNVFLSRLCGEPIGFTVLGIFVIDKNTVLTVSAALNRCYRLISMRVKMYSQIIDKKLSYRRETARRAVTVKTVLNVAQMFVELHLISPALGE